VTPGARGRLVRPVLPTIGGGPPEGEPRTGGGRTSIRSDRIRIRAVWTSPALNTSRSGFPLISTGTPRRGSGFPRHSVHGRAVWQRAVSGVILGLSLTTYPGPADCDLLTSPTRSVLGYPPIGSTVSLSSVPVPPMRGNPGRAISAISPLPPLLRGFPAMRPVRRGFSVPAPPMHGPLRAYPARPPTDRPHPRTGYGPHRPGAHIRKTSSPGGPSSAITNNTGGVNIFSLLTQIMPTMI